jgi:cytochrome P450
MTVAEGCIPFLYDPEDEATQRDPYPAYRRLRDAHPVYRQERLRFWALTRFADVHAALCDHGTFSSAHGLTWDERAAEEAGVLPMLVTTDPPAHTTLRRLVNRGFSPRRVEALEPAVRRLVTDALARLRRAGGGDLVTDLAVPLPTAIIGAFLDVPDADREEFHGWATAVVAGTSGPEFHAAHHAATRALYGYFQRLIAVRRAVPGDDLLSTLLAADAGGEALADRQALGFCFNLIVGGIETTTSLLTSGAVHLQADPALRATLAGAAARIPAAIEEFLRLETPVQGLCRTTTRPVEIHGVTIPAGEKVLLAFGAANRDEREFPEPDRLDLDRVVERHLAFGYGAHYCIGAALARLVGRVAFEELIPALPGFRIDVARGRRVRSAVNRSWLSLPLTVAPA